MLKWYERTDSQHDIFVASRVRLVRNIEHNSFPSRISSEECRKLLNKMKKEFSDINSVDSTEYNYSDLEVMGEEYRNMLQERRIINKTMVDKKSPAGILLSEDESSGIIMNGDDHFKFYRYSCSDSLNDLWEKVNVMDDYINSHFAYAYSEKYGYLTSFPTNVGTGMKASVILHIPTLSGSRQFKTLFNEMGRFGITIKGIYTENSENYGSLYEISNQKTLGQSEEDILAVVARMAEQLAASERKLRSVLLRSRRISVEDEVYKSFGVLKYARKLTMKEAMSYLSQVRTGLLDGLISTDKPVNIFGIMMNIQPASLSRNFNVSEEKGLDMLRAEYIREHLPALI